MKKTVVVSIFILLICFISACNKQETKNVMLPDVQEIEYMYFVVGDECKTVEDKEQIKLILSELSNAEISNLQSLNDTPQTESYIKITFETLEGISSNTVYLYEKEYKFYLEQPYHGIFKIKEKAYNSIVEKIKAEQ